MSYEVHLSREQALQGLEIEEPIVADLVSTIHQLIYLITKPYSINIH